MPMKATIDTEQLRIFAAVVAENSFTRAADLLETNKAHVSRVVARLEDHLGARLLQRSTRALSLTEAGRELNGRARAILAALDEAEAALRHRTDQPSGHLRLTCGHEFGLLQVNGWIAEYLRLYPDVAVEADFSNRIADIIHEGFDVAIRDGDLADCALSARKLGELAFGLYAHPAYLAARGIPEFPQGLFGHDLIVFAAGARTPWQLRNGEACVTVDQPARYAVNTHMAVRDIAADGFGIAQLPVFQAAPLVAGGSLVPVLPGWAQAPVAVHAVFPSSRYLTPNVRSFIDIARSRFLAQPAASVPASALSISTTVSATP